MTVETSRADAGGDLAAPRHVMIVGGTYAEWNAVGSERWDDLVATLGAWCGRAGVRWLTLRTYECGPAGTPPFDRWSRSSERCDVIVDPTGDGRQRFADAMSQLDPADRVNEASVTSVLYEPADSEPDLVVVLGPSTRLPPSLVWELAYAELVFIDGEWSELTVEHLAGAVADFAGRRRRFGGLDSGDEASNG